MAAKDAQIEEYLRRNLSVAKAIGAKASIEVSRKRLTNQKRYHKWLLECIDEAIVRLEPIPKELADYRDSVGADEVIAKTNKMVRTNNGG